MTFGLSTKNRSILEELALAPGYEHQWDLGVNRQGSRKDRTCYHTRQETEVHGRGHKGEGASGRNYGDL